MPSSRTACWQAAISFSSPGWRRLDSSATLLQPGTSSRASPIRLGLSSIDMKLMPVALPPGIAPAKSITPATTGSPLKANTTGTAGLARMTSGVAPPWATDQRDARRLQLLHPFGDGRRVGLGIAVEHRGHLGAGREGGRQAALEDGQELLALAAGCSTDTQPMTAAPPPGPATALRPAPPQAASYAAR